MQQPKRVHIPLTTIGRRIDLRDRTNAGIAALSLCVVAAGALLHLGRGSGMGSSLMTGLAWGGSAFLSWAVARETDPDRWLSAFFAAGGALAGVILLGNPHFLLLLWILLALRYVNRTTGLAPGVLDWIGMCGILLWLGFSTHWTIPLLAFLTVFFAGLRRLPSALRIGLPLLLLAATVTYGLLQAWHFTIPALNNAEILVIAGVPLAVLPVIVSYRRTSSVGDQTGTPLTAYRLQWAIAWAVVAALVLTLSGTAKVADIAPLWSALAGSALGWALNAVSRRTRHSSSP